MNAIRTRWRAMFASVILAALGLEFFLVFVNRGGEFLIEGNDPYDLVSFGSGSAVSHAFLMRGDGLTAVRLRFNSDTETTVTVHWTLWRGLPDEPQDMTRAFEGEETVELRPGRQWKRFAFTRDASSRDRWYTIEVRLVAAASDPAPRPKVALIATNDNPDRGGALWVDGVRKGGSLVVAAERLGRTISRRFVVDVEPNLPAVLRVRAVQWLILVVLHWALVAFAYTIVSEGARMAASLPERSGT